MEDALASVEDVLSSIASRHRLTQDEADDFRGEILLKLVKDDYAILRKYTGKGPLTAYLAVVINRLHLDYRRRLWGKWRPSAEALRIGPVALRLEELIYRESLSYHEACVVLESRFGFGASAEELDRIWARLPVRSSRRTEDLDEFVEPVASGGDPESDALDAERRRRLASLYSEISAHRDELPSEDAMILRLRFDSGLAISEIARALGLEQRPLYRRIPALLARLREHLEELGHSKEELQSLLGQDSGTERRAAKPIRKSVSERQA